MKIGDEVDYLHLIDACNSWDYEPAVIEGFSPDGLMLQLFIVLRSTRVEESRFSGKIQNGGKARAK